MLSLLTKKSVDFAAALMTTLAVSFPGLGAPSLAATVPSDTAELAAATAPETIPSAWAILSISNAGNGYYRVTVRGHLSVTRPAPIVISVFGDDPWDDDFLFRFSGYLTDEYGDFWVSQVVHRSLLNEDWEGQDEIYAIAALVGGGDSARTNMLSGSY